MTTTVQLRELRMRAGLTQDEAARLVYKSESRTWRRWESGDRAIDEAIVHLFCHLTAQPYPFEADAPIPPRLVVEPEPVEPVDEPEPEDERLKFWEAVLARLEKSGSINTATRWRRMREYDLDTLKDHAGRFGM